MSFYEDGSQYLRKGQYRKAIDYFTLSIKRQIEVANSYFGRGLSQYYMKQNTDAIKDFDKAIEVATTNVKALVKNAKNIELEGAILSDDNKLYEICLSYDMQGESPFLTNNDNLSQLARLMRYRREYKVFSRP